MDIEQKVKLIIDSCGILEPKLLIALSGGMDSIALLNIVKKVGYEINAVHVNFGLRNEESNDDEKFVIETCRNMDIKLIHKKVDTKYFSKKHSLSIQESARKLRYDFFEEVRKENHLDFILTAHHMQDNIETFIFNLARGKHIFKNPSGIPQQNGHILRPLININKRDINLYIEQNNLVYREDSSNSNTKYSRNFIRHGILPQLLKINSNAIEHIAEYLNGIEVTEQIVNNHYDTLIKQNLRTIDNGIIFNTTSIKNLPYYSKIILKFLEKKGFSYAQTLEIIGSKQSGSSWKTAEWRLSLDRNDIYLNKINSLPTDNDNVITINHLERDFILFKNQKIQFNEFNAANYRSKQTNVLFFDKQKLALPLLFRSWRSGDRITPLGFKSGSKKVSDFLIDNKIPKHQKEDVIIIEDAKGIVAVFPFIIANRVKIETETTEVLSISTEKQKG